MNFNKNKDYWRGLWKCNDGENLSKEIPIQFRPEKNCKYPFPYISQYGIQGRFFGFISSYFPFGSLRKTHFYIFNIVVLALLLSIMNIVFLRYVGMMGFVFSFVSSLWSPWLTLIAKNLYWVWWLSFLPFCVSIYFFLNAKLKLSNKNQAYYFFVLFILILLKSLAGYEYLSVIGVSVVIPPFLCFLIKKTSFRSFVGLCLKSLLVFLSGFLVALMIHAYSMTTLYGGLNKSFAAIMDRAVVRTHMAEKDIKRSYGNVPEADLAEIYELYSSNKMMLIKTPLFHFRSKMYRMFIYVFFILFLYLTLLKRREKNQRVRVGLCLASFASFLPPLSWFTLARLHSQWHPHINFVLWHYSTTIFIFPLFGLFTSDFLKFLKRRLNYKQKVDP
jgi:hypothetical protein